jgi:hypothetical protein
MPHNPVPYTLTLTPNPAGDPARPPPSPMQVSAAHLCFAGWQGAAQVQHCRPAADCCGDVAGPALQAEAVLAGCTAHILALEVLKADHALQQKQRVCGRMCGMVWVYRGRNDSRQQESGVPTCMHVQMCCNAGTTSTGLQLGLKFLGGQLQETLPYDACPSSCCCITNERPCLKIYVSTWRL